VGALRDKGLKLYFAPVRMGPGGEEAAEAGVTVHSDTMERDGGPGFGDRPLKVLTRGMWGFGQTYHHDMHLSARKALLPRPPLVCIVSPPSPCVPAMRVCRTLCRFSHRQIIVLQVQ